MHELFMCTCIVVICYGRGISNYYFVVVVVVDLSLCGIQLVPNRNHIKMAITQKRK